MASKPVGTSKASSNIGESIKMEEFLIREVVRATDALSVGC
jgi:hypothetical protein